LKKPPLYKKKQWWHSTCPGSVTSGRSHRGIPVEGSWFITQSSIPRFFL